MRSFLLSAAVSFLTLFTPTFARDSLDAVEDLAVRGLLTRAAYDKSLGDSDDSSTCNLFNVAVRREW